MRTVLESLRRRISPQWAEWTEPTGGYLVWLELKGARAPDRAWGDIFAAHGVRVARGPQFFAANHSRPSMRLSISALNSDEIAEGVHRLAAALEEICACGCSL